ncbi:dolichyl-phosphate beta-D-mannosyltransferase [Candidatus Nanopelagicaceae bacterium]
MANPQLKPVILIPTYNESISIVELLRELKNLRNEIPFDVFVLDDNSPDKTADIVDDLHCDWVTTVRRPNKNGLGAAYRAGFERVLSTDKYTHVITMDADGSHRVADLPAMIEAISEGKCAVLGTRWMPGGSVVNWPKSRQLLSRAGTAYARLALRIPMKDLTGGFRIYSTSLLRALNLKDMTATGYCFQIEMAMASELAGATMVEVPITFVERVNGVSKMSRAIVMEALWQTTLWGLTRTLRPNADKLHYVK